MSIYKINTSKLFTKVSLRLFFVLTFLSSTDGFTQINPSKKKLLPNQSPSTSRLSNIKDSLINKTKVRKNNLSTNKDSLIQSSIESQLYHYAEDYTEINENKKFIKLYNNAHIKYEDIDLKAGIIYIDYDKKEVYAGRIIDSLGKLTQKPVFKQGNTETENDSIRFNFETKKALVWNTYAREGEFSMISEVTKKYNDSIIFVKNIKFTTSKDKENPEYYFLAKKAKIVPKKKIVVGTTQMWIEDVATPFFIPFGFFPLIETRQSGFLMPTFADTRYGFALTNGGFYWVLGPYMDLTTTADIYTNGSFELNTQSNYKKRYRFNGKLSFRYLNQIESERGLPDYKKNVNWKLIWQHNTDAKSNPLSSFSAKVDFGNSKYYRNSYNYENILNPDTRLSNEIGSSVSYQHRMRTLPVNFSVNLNHTQNINTESIKFTLPQIHLNVSRIYPFSKKGLKNNAFQKINFTYKLDAQNLINTTDSLLFTKNMWNSGRIGAKHSIPINSNFKIFKYFNFQPQVQYTEVWTMQTIRKYWDENANQGNGEEVTIAVNGFESFRNISTSASLSTTLYGTYIFGNDKLIKGIRHQISTSLSASYNPIFNRFIKQYYIPSKDTLINYTIFDQEYYGKPNILESKNLNLSISNSFEAKVRTKQGKDKKIRFLNINTGYNFLKDSMRIIKPTLSSTAQITTGLTVNMNAIFDPYSIDENGANINKWALLDNQGIGRIQNFRLATGYNFNNQTFSKKNKKENNKTQQSFYNNKIGWNANVSYNFNYVNKAYNPNNPYFKQISIHSLSFTGKVSFSPTWQITYRSGYDIVNKDFTFTQLSFYRDLKSWQMSFTWKPMDPSYWYFNISIKSSALQGIKYDKRKEPLKPFF